MPDINWGGDSSTAPFSSRLDEANGDLIIAEDNSGGTVLLEYDGSTWQYRGPVDMNGENISGVGTLTATDATISGTVDSGAVNTETIADDYLYTGAFDGSDPDARLDNALNAAVDGETIYLERGVYNANHTVSNRVTLTGLSTDTSGTKIESTIDLTASNIVLGTVRLTGTLNVSGYTCILKDAFALNGSVNVSGGRFRMYGCHKGNVTFQSGTSSGIVDACSETVVTDNGANTVGDIA
jgi:hypothetical protein